MEYVGGAVGGASGAALGFIAADVPGAWAGAKYGWDAGKNFAKNKTNKEMPPIKRRAPITPPRTPKRSKVLSRLNPARKAKPVYNKIKKRIAMPTKKKLTGVSTGANGGKFAKPGPLTKNFETVGAKLGYVTGHEIYGQVVDSDCVYMYHSTYNLELTIRSILGALTRTLLRKAGIEVGNQQSELTFNSPSDSGGFLFRMEWVNGQGQSQYREVRTDNNWSFDTLVNNLWDLTTPTSLGFVMNAYLVDGGWDFTPYSYSLYQDDSRNIDGTNYTTRLRAFMTLGDEFVVVKQMSGLTVQNRTKGSLAGATDYSVDRIDNQPLKGKLYEFNHADPRIKTQQITGTGMTDHKDVAYGTGDFAAIRAFGANQLPGEKLMLEPPEPTIWRNIAKTSNVNLEPGVMKKCYIVEEYKNRFPVLLRKLKIEFAPSPLPGQNIEPYTGLRSGKSQILCLEEVLRTADDNQITCIYEVEHKVSSYTYTKKLKGTLKTRMFKGEKLQATL